MYKKLFMIFTLLFVSLATSVLAAENETVDSTMNITGNLPTSTIFLAVAGESFTGSVELQPNTTTTVSCWGKAEDLDGYADLADLTTNIYATSSSRYDVDNTSIHYTNNTCDMSDWNLDGTWNCTYQVQYYAEPSSWTCAINITNTDPQYYNDTINESATFENLIALSVHNKTVDFGLRAVTVNYTADTEVRVYNEGNVVLDLLLDAFNQSSVYTDDSDQAFNCDIGHVPIHYLRFALAFDTPYLSSVPMEGVGATAAQSLGLAPQVGGNVMGDLPTYDATWWAPAIPDAIAGTCNGRIMYIGQQQ